MIPGHERAQAYQHLKDSLKAGVGLFLIGAVAINATESLQNELIAINVGMIGWMCLMAYSYHLFMAADIIFQWGFRQRIQQTMRPEAH